MSLYPASSPATQAAGVAIASATLNSHRDWINFLQAPPIGRCTFTTQPSIPNQASPFTMLAWDTEQFDTGGDHAANASSIIPTTAGYYEINGAVVFTPVNTTGLRRAAIFVNGTGVAGTAMADIPPSATQSAIIEVHLVAFFNGTTDAFAVGAQQSSGGALALQSVAALGFGSFVDWKWIHS